MRGNIIAAVLAVLLVVLVAGSLLRAREPHLAPIAPAEAQASAAASAEASAAALSATASASPSASASAAPTAASDVPKLDRPLRVVGLGWDLLAAGIIANDGAQGGPASALKKRGLELRLASAADAGGVESALARGGADERGADVAILPLPTFVTSYERLRALDPVIFLVVGWSEGREQMFGKSKSLDTLAGSDVKLRAESGSAAAFVGLFALDVSGVSPDHVKLVTKPTDAWDFAALARRQSKESEQASGTLLFGTAEASRLVPIVAVAQAALLAKSEPAVSAFAEGWLEGQHGVAADAAGAARKVATAEGAPEPLAMLASLGEIGPASLGENASALGLSGRGASTLEKLFGKSWDLWRSAKVLGIPPERAPIDGRVVAALVRAGGALTPPPVSGTPRKEKPSAGKPLLVHRVGKGKLDEDALLETVGFLAGVFPRSTVKVSVHSRSDVDKKLTASVLARAEERFGLAKGRLGAGSERARDGSAATVEVMPVP